MVIDFKLKKEDNIWRIKEVENLEELAAVAHTRFLIYSKNGLINPNELKVSTLYKDFLFMLKAQDKDYFNGEYEFKVLIRLHFYC